MKVARLHPGKGRVVLYLGMPGWISQIAIAVVARGSVGRSLEFDLWAPKWARRWFHYAYVSLGIRYSGEWWARTGSF